MRLLLILLFSLSLAACYKEDTIRPNHIIEDAHGGGSIVALGNNDTLGASGGWAGDIKTWALKSGQLQHEWQAHSDSVNGLKFYQNDQRLISAGYDGKVRKWTQNGHLIQELRTHSPITSMATASNLTWLVTGHQDGSIMRWRFNDLQLIDQHRFHTDWVRAVAIDSNNEKIASSDADGNVYLWNMRKIPTALTHTGSDMRTLAFSENGNVLLGGTWFDLYRWDLVKKTTQRLSTEHAGIINSIKVAADGKSLLTISRQTDSAVLSLDANTGQTLHRYTSHDLCGVDIDVSSSGKYLMTTSDDASVRIWSLTH